MREYYGLSSDDVEMFEIQHEELINELENISANMEDIKPNDYELEIKRLVNDNKKLKEINKKISNAFDKQDKFINELIDYIKNYIPGVTVECHYGKSNNFNNTIELETITIPSKTIIRSKEKYK